MKTFSTKFKQIRRDGQLSVSTITRIKQITKITVLTVIFGLSIIIANAQNKQKVAVYVTGDADNGTKKVIGAKLVSAITRDDGYAAVERTADFLAELSKEQSYQLSGAVADNQIVALGRQFGVRFVCVAEVSSIYGATFVSARMINVETAVVTATAERDKEVNGMADLTELAEDTAEGLINNVAPCNKKGNPVDKKGCCDGLVVIDGICSDLNEYVKNKYNLEILLKKSNDERCPTGWRIPTKDDLVSLSKIQKALSSIIPIQTYRTDDYYNDTYNKTIPFCKESKYNYVVKCGNSGFYSVDLGTGVVKREIIFQGGCQSCWGSNSSEGYYYDKVLPYPPFWVK